ncbi:MAG: hypothetical protein Q4D16_12020 [Eubacteriales bacterium]|nr:hypothetical protein [Eubacteriales bacterium]
MKDSEIKILLKECRGPEIDRECKEKSIRFVTGQMKDIRVLYHISYWERLKNMAGYLSPWVWAVQAAILMLLGYFAVLDSQSMLPAAVAAVPLLGCIGCMEIQRGYMCGMWEMEKACRYDLRQVVLLKLQIMGGVDMAVVVCLLAMATGRGITLSKAVFYILLPYFISCFIYFTILCRTDRRASDFVIVGAGILMSAVMWVLLNCIDEVMWSYLDVRMEWTALAAIAAADLMLLSVRRFWKICDKESNKVWSYD